MPRQPLVLGPTEASAPSQSLQGLRARLRAIREEVGVGAPYPAEAVAEAEQVADAPPDLPVADLTEVPFWTLDPPGSMDLDQALCLDREGEGYRVRYAIADVPAFVAPGGELDRVTRERGQTIYSPDERVPLHPAVLSEAAASLLPGEVRPAYVWDLRLTADGSLREHGLQRALVRSRERLDYATVQEAVDGGTTDERLILLREVGERRVAQERARGGASLPMPEQQVSQTPDGGFGLEFRPPLASEDWNAQISLLTGMVAAQIMIAGGWGILRTMPRPADSAIARFRRQARALGAPWPEDQPYGEFIRSLDRHTPRHLALIHEATGLFRGAGYTPLLGEIPAEHEHAAVAAPYAHVTAPLRRLVDRFGLVACEHMVRGEPVPQWVVDALPALPELMTLSGRKAGAVERASADAAEAAVLSQRVGERFAAVVVDHTEKGMEVQLTDVPVLAMATGGRTALGAAVEVTLVEADPTSGTVTFRYR